MRRFSVTQRFYRGRQAKNRAAQAKRMRPRRNVDTRAMRKTIVCPSAPREWASWEIAQEYFIDPNFGGAVIPAGAMCSMPRWT